MTWLFSVEGPRETDCWSIRCSIASEDFRKESKQQKLVQRMMDHATRFGLKIVKEKVQSVEVDPNEVEKAVVLKDGMIRCKSVIVATDAHAHRIDVEGRRSSRCGGNLSDKVWEASEYHLPEKPVGSNEGDQERAFNNPKIKSIWDTVVASINGDDFVRGITLKNVKTGDALETVTPGVFIFFGIVPSSDCLKHTISLDRDGFVIVNREMETNVSGIFAAGDVVSKRLRQISSSVGEGATAVFNAERYLETVEHS